MNGTQWFIQRELDRFQSENEMAMRQLRVARTLAELRRIQQPQAKSYLRSLTRADENRFTLLLHQMERRLRARDL